MESYVYESLEMLRKAHKGGLITYIEYWNIGVRRVWIKKDENYYCEFATTNVTQQLQEQETL